MFKGVRPGSLSWNEPEQRDILERIFTAAMGVDLKIDSKLIFPAGTPVNAANASGTLTLSGAVSDGETVTIGNDVYEFDTGDGVEEGNIAVDVSGGATAAAAVTALVAAITASGIEPVTATDGTGDTVVVTADVAGAVGNSIAVATDADNASWGAGNTALKGGVNGTVAEKWDVKFDSSYLYICIDDNAITGKNWRRISIGAAY